MLCDAISRLTIYDSEGREAIHHHDSESRATIQYHDSESRATIWHHGSESRATIGPYNKLITRWLAAIDLGLRDKR